MHLHRRFLSHYLGQEGEHDLEKVTEIMHRLFEVHTRQVDAPSLNVCAVGKITWSILKLQDAPPAFKEHVILMIGS